MGIKPEGAAGVDMNCETLTISWDDFKNESSTDQYKTIIYRGHSNIEWRLIPTLGRFIQSNSMLDSDYYEIINDIYTNTSMKDDNLLIENYQRLESLVTPMSRPVPKLFLGDITFPSYW